MKSEFVEESNLLVLNKLERYALNPKKIIRGVNY